MNLSLLPEEALVAELLGPDERASTRLESLPSLLCDGEASGTDTSARGMRVSHLLSVSRELLLRRLQRDMSASPIFDSPAALRDWLRLYCAGLQHEVFLVMFLDAQHRLIDVEPLFRGTVNQTAVYPREVVKAALSRNAAVVVFAHNHPSGSGEPSRADEYLTATLKSALALVDVRVIDHFVVAGDRLVSFAERGLL